jgi:hypothetical protein
MGPDTIWVFIPLAAIVLGIGKGILQSILQTIERIHQARLDAARSASGFSDDQLGLIRAEMAQLRDTTTQHAISIQHSLERLEQRVDFLERKSSDAYDSPSGAAPRQQVIGRV